MLPALFLFLIGLCIGSFLNVVIFRTHAERSVVRGRSRCMVCEVALGPTDLIPLVSYVALRGRCRSCGTAISWQYPAVELATGLLFLLVYWRYLTGFGLPPIITPDTWGVAIARDCIFVAYLVVLFVYDLRYGLILDRFSIPAMFLALVFNLWIGISPLSLLLGGLAIGTFFFMQHFISKGEWIGGGDIRMGVLMGLMLGLRDGLMALFIAYMVGAVVGLFLLASRRAAWQTAVPFGTFLAVGTVTVMFFGEFIANWYAGYLFLG